MGVSYYVVPAAIADQFPWAADTLRRFDMLPHLTHEPGRNPTLLEVREVLGELPDFSVDYVVGHDNWQAEIRADAGAPLLRSTALLNAIDFRGDETIPHLICFEKGDLKLDVLIVEHLSRICGTIYVIPDTGARPLPVHPGIDPSEAVRYWKTK
jgi:hypothetical protein